MFSNLQHVLRNIKKIFTRKNGQINKQPEKYTIYRLKIHKELHFLLTMIANGSFKFDEHKIE